eukprot:Tbor_TRINITY_DN5697_c2_g1::TRINITY_DN5697_c2_g1_i1::g.8751::m.8751
MGFSRFPVIPRNISKETPGPGNYEVKNGFGSKSSTKHVTIQGANHIKSNSGTANIGPGSYDYRNTIGDGPKISISTSKRLEDSGHGVTGDMGPKYDIENCTSMAGNPVSPKYTIRGKAGASSALSSKFLSSFPGPGEYDISKTDAFNSRYRLYKGPTISPPSYSDEKSEVLAGTPKDLRNVPGPGNYDIKRFGDDVPSSRVTHFPHPQVVKAPGPGPGEYEVDQISIKKATKSRVKLVSASTFGGRYEPGNRNISPGPGAYDIDTEGKNPHARKRGVTLGMRPRTYGDINIMCPHPGPGEYAPEMEFSKIGGFISPPPTVGICLKKPLIYPGSGAYTPKFGDLSEKADALRTLDAVRKQINPEYGTQRTGGPRVPVASKYVLPGPGHYDTMNSPFSKTCATSRKGFTFGGRHTSGALFDNFDSTPGPGTYNMKYPGTIDDVCSSSTNSQGKGPCFYKGQYLRERDPHDTIPGPGHYNISDSYNYITVHNNGPTIGAAIGGSDI